MVLGGVKYSARIARARPARGPRARVDLGTEASKPHARISGSGLRSFSAQVSSMHAAGFR